MQKLIEDAHVNEKGLPMLQIMFLALSQMILRMVPEHLPDGKFWDPSDTHRKQTTSAKKHNKMPEFVFRQLEHLITFGPNSSLLPNKAYVMYSFNKTSKWLDQLPKSEQDKYLEVSRKDGINLRKQI